MDKQNVDSPYNGMAFIKTGNDVLTQATMQVGFKNTLLSQRAGRNGHTLCDSTSTKYPEQANVYRQRAGRRWLWEELAVSASECSYSFFGFVN